MSDVIDNYINFARSMVGVKWRHRGRKPWAVDCLGLVVMSLQSAGIKCNDRDDYGREPWNEGLKEALKDHFGEPVKNWKPGDIALMQWDGLKEPSHVGFIADYKYGGLSLIHSYSETGVVEHRIDDVWLERIKEVYRPWVN